MNDLRRFVGCFCGVFELIFKCDELEDLIFSDAGTAEVSPLGAELIQKVKSMSRNEITPIALRVISSETKFLDTIFCSSFSAIQRISETVEQHLLAEACAIAMC